MKKHLLLAAISFFIFVSFSFGQNIFPSSGSAGIGTTAPNASSLLEVKSTTKGVLIPRMTTAQRNAIGTPAQGLLIFQTDGPSGFYYYNSGWKVVTPAVSGYAAKSLNNLTTTAINLDLLPGTTAVRNLGSSLLAWKDIYLRGDVYLDGTRFVSNYPGVGSFNAFLGSYSGRAITTGTYNTAVGHNAMFSTTSGSENVAVGANTLYTNTTGHNNTAIGRGALYTNDIGYDNTAMGWKALNVNTNGFENVATGSQALYSNTGGSFNTAIGKGSLYSNTSGAENTASGWKALTANTFGGYNVASGSQALSKNYGGSYNVAVGQSSLYNNANGSWNTATGEGSLYGNTTGNYNTASGVFSLPNNSTGNYNTGVGEYALYYNTVENYNTAIGYSAGDYKSGANNTLIGALAYPNADGFTNSSSLGYNSHNTASNQIVLGSSSVTSIIAGSGFMIYSDGRFKKNLKENVPGLEFIELLKPLTYTYDVHAIDTKLKGSSPSATDAKRKGQTGVSSELDEKAMIQKEKIVYTGLIAQDVEAAATKVNYDFSGVHKPSGDNDVYALSYSDFVVPLIKAVQELDIKNKKLEEDVASLKQMVMDLTNRTPNNTLPGSSSYLEQNTPNPSGSSSSIRYHVPSSAKSVNITVTNVKGQLMKSINLNNNGTGQLTLNSSAWAAGTYNYTLWVDGKQADTRQMVKTR